MTILVYEFDWPDRVVVGTVGLPGSRTFYLQARTGGRTTSVALEKEQSAILAEMIDRLLDELMTSDDRLTIPAEAPAELLDDEPLEQPVEEDFRAGSMRLGWDPRTAQLVIEAFPVDEEPSDAAADTDDAAADTDEADVEPDDDEAEPSEMLLVRIPVGTARAFAHRARRVVAAGRPACPDCGMPMDDDGHECAADAGA
ncbi:DUF3090 domain-containing protein [Isoptericola cucumis]|uniref:Repeat protein (TIGR03847 family) n=1 Tax=Isoptericola cucumis TaxID=1776856 RepID=A0ABQ2B4A5_9MICO|nr:DUF3090 domain-containing protein [Isoptericola cucumis]GGI06116.1 hypothetical protein GCM10007368_09540 [Isoptericola cucumis]